MRMKHVVTMVLAMLCAAGPALAADRSKRDRELSEAFIGLIRADAKAEKPRFAEAARNRILELWKDESKAETVKAEFIDEALRVLILDYQRGALRIDAERLDEARAILGKLRTELADFPTADGPKYQFEGFLKAGVMFHLARVAIRDRYWELAEERLEGLRGDAPLAKYILDWRAVEMMTAQAYGRVGRLDEAVDIAKSLSDTEEGRKLLARLEVARDGASLDDVADTMHDVKELLEAAKVEMETRNKQNRIIAMLEMMIEEAEDQEQGGGGGGGGGEGQSESQGQGQGQGQGPPSGSGPPSSPAEESGLPGGAADDEGKAANTATMGDFWARLPARERAKVLDALRKEFPQRYKDLIEEYYKALQEGGE
jgi:hypothetical protein